MPVSNGIWCPKWVPKSAQKRVRNGDPENAIQPVICVPENGVCPVRGSQKWFKNDPKKEHFLDNNDADLADVSIIPAFYTAKYSRNCDKGSQLRSILATGAFFFVTVKLLK